jgi:hypothetical protein
MTVSFNDEEWRLIVAAAGSLRQQDRDAFLRSIAAQMKPRRCDLVEAIRRSINYLQQHSGEQNDAA